MCCCRRPRFYGFRLEKLNRAASTNRAFTLLELLVAISVLSILSLALLAISGGATNIWSQGISDNEARLRSRAVLDYIGCELRQASLAVNQASMASLGKPTLQFLINPSSVNLKYPQNIFWQAPIATDDHSQGDMAEVGYFIRWGVNNHANLCRYFVNPTTTTDYLIYSASSGTWVTGGTSALSGSGTAGDLDKVAPADKAHQYQGLFLENVLGLWVQAYAVDGTALSLPYNSSSPPNPAHPLPASVVISIVVLDDASANRLAQNLGAITTIKSLSQSSADAPTFVTSLLAEPPATVPGGVTHGATIASIKVCLDNYR